MSVARLYDRTPVHCAERTPARRCMRKTKITSGGGYVHSSGRSVTRLTAYHISRHVASTFKCLTTATTHYDLIKFSSTQTGFLTKVMNHNHNPVRHPYSGCRNVNIATPIKFASDRQSLDFYRSYKLSN
jgi:hypothetical protein